MGWPRPLQTRSARLAATGAAAVVLFAAAAYALLPLAVAAFTATIDLTISEGVSVATLVGGGADLSTILIAIGREVFRALASGRALEIITALVIVSAAALYGLQRVLALEEETHAN
jgi:hypothetical protein